MDHLERREREEYAHQQPHRCEVRKSAIGHDVREWQARAGGETEEDRAQLGAKPPRDEGEGEHGEGDETDDEHLPN